MLEDITWILKYLIILMNFFILYILYKKKKEGKTERVQQNKGKQVLLLTAHPDDEVMFFLPLLEYLTSEGFSIHVLCMTYGRLQQDPSSEIRKKEFEKVMQALSISQYQIVDSPRIRDSQDTSWDSEDLGSVVDKYVLEHKINCVFSFDKGGISGHCNHCDLFKFLETRAAKYKAKNVKIYSLETVNILRKYVLVFDGLWIVFLEFINVLGIIIKGKEVFDYFMFFNLNFR